MMTINPSDDTGKHLLIPRSTRQKQTKRVERKREDTADELDPIQHPCSLRSCKARPNYHPLPHVFLGTEQNFHNL